MPLACCTTGRWWSTWRGHWAPPTHLPFSYLARMEWTALLLWPTQVPETIKPLGLWHASGPETAKTPEHGLKPLNWKPNKSLPLSMYFSQVLPQWDRKLMVTSIMMGLETKTWTQPRQQPCAQQASWTAPVSSKLTTIWKAMEETRGCLLGEMSPLPPIPRIPWKTSSRGKPLSSMPQG